MTPSYNIPLTDPQLAALGKLGAVWGQMDYLLVVAIGKLLGISVKDCEVLFDRAPAGARIAAFKRFAASVAHQEARDLALSFVKKADGVLGRRNHLTHGIWGLFCPDGEGPYKAACYHPQNKKGLIYAGELESITAGAIEVTNVLIQFLSLEESVELQQMQDRKLCMGYGPPEGRYAAPPGSAYLDLASLGHSPD